EQAGDQVDRDRRPRATGHGGDLRPREHRAVGQRGQVGQGHRARCAGPAVEDRRDTRRHRVHHDVHLRGELRRRVGHPDLRRGQAHRREHDRLHDPRPGRRPVARRHVLDDGGQRPRAALGPPPRDGVQRGEEPRVDQEGRGTRL
ncbi:MAG: hypothetical protein AVDCRST_MAG54-4331, partial [uncultured Actinomycetospora sp.]